MKDADRAVAKRITVAMKTMKLDVAALEAAAKG